MTEGGGDPIGNCGVEGAGVCGVGGGGPFDDFLVERIASGLSRPVYATTPVGDVDRLFVVEQHTGRIRIINLADNSINATPFLEIDGLPTSNATINAPVRSRSRIMKLSFQN